MTERPTLDPETMALWDAWVHGKIISALESFAEIEGDEAGQAENRLRADIRQMLDDIRAEFTTEANSLRHSIETEMKQIRKDFAVDRGEVIDMPNFVKSK